MVFHWSLSDSKSPQVSRTLLRILANLINVVILMVSALHLINKSSCHYYYYYHYYYCKFLTSTFADSLSLKSE